MKWLTLAALACWAPSLMAQSEAALRQYFEGKAVTIKLAMPGTDDGIDVYPGTGRPLDYSRYADRLKANGTALRAGESTVVTRIRVKQKHIEFQLGGGGYGTFGDETSSGVAVPAAEKTKREKTLEALIKGETDPVRKREMREELDDLRAEREREDASNRANVAEAEEHRKQNIRQRRLEGGSRFNIRYGDAVPASALTPDGVMTALAEYVDFGQLRRQGAPLIASQEQVSSSPGGNGSSPAAGLPRKGMLLKEVEALLGPAARASERTEGTLKVLTREYLTPDGRVIGEFVEGVLIRYTIKSE